MKVSKYSIIFIIVIFVILVIFILNITRYFDKIEEFITLYGYNRDYIGKYNTICKKCTDCPSNQHRIGCTGTNTGTCVDKPYIDVYEHDNYALYSSNSKTWGMKYLINSDTETLGGQDEMGDNSISSIWNPKGHSVSLYRDANFGGLCKDFTSSVQYLSSHIWSDGSSMDNSVSSIKVGKTCADG